MIRTKIRESPVIGLLLAVFVSIFVFLIIMEILSDQNSVDTRDFYQNIPKSKNIFLLGSSQIRALDPNFISDYIEKYNYNFDVYNLAKNGDTPELRLSEVDQIISSNPDLIVYGIGFRDFTKSNVSSNNNTDFPLPDPSKFFSDLLSSPFKLKNIQNPKFIFLSFVNDHLLSLKILSQNENYVDSPYSNAPFLIFHKTHFELSDEYKLENQLASEYKIDNILLPEYNQQSISFTEFVRKMHENDIKIIIFTTPYSKIWLDKQPIENIQNFDLIIQNLSDTLDVEIHIFHDKYENMSIWQNPSHVSLNNKTLIFSEDISNIIMDKLKK